MVVVVVVVVSSSSSSNYLYLYEIPSSKRLSIIYRDIVYREPNGKRRTALRTIQFSILHIVEREREREREIDRE